MKIGKADLRLKLKKYGNEATLVFSSMKIGKADLRLKWKKWEMFVLCILIDTHRITYQEKPYRRNKKVLSTKIPIKRIESLIDIKK